MLLKKDEKTYLGLFYLHAALEASFNIVWVYWIVYFLDQGFSYSVIGVALALNGASMAIFEVPTGALADAVSRKFSVITGLVGFGVILIIMPFIANPLLLIVIFVVWGIPITLVSGAEQAWVVDNLRAEEREDLVKEYYVKYTSIRNVGGIVAALLSGIVVRFLGMDALWYINGAAVLGSVLVLVIQKEHFERRIARIQESFKETYNNIREGARFTVHEKNVLYIMVANFFVVVGAELLLICSKPFLEDIGVPREYFGYLTAVGAVFCVGMPFVAKYLAGLFSNEKYYLSLHSLVFGVLLASIILVETPVMAAFLFVIFALRQTTITPVLEPFFQGFLPRRLRATVGSFRNMVICTALLVGDFAISACADSAGSQVMLAVGGVVMLPAIVFYMGVRPVDTDADLKS